MPRDLFDAPPPLATRSHHRWYTMPLAIVTHGVLIGALVVVPLFATSLLPPPAAVVVYVPDHPPSPPPPPEVDRTPAPVVVEDVPSPDAAPVAEPESLQPETPTPPAERLVVRQADLPAVVAGPARALEGPPPVSAQPDIPSGPVRVGGNIKEPRRIDGPAPAYPMVARAARAEGTVRLEAVIGKDGLVKDLRVVESHPMFDEAAMDAVRRWRYTVPLLNGQPIDVVMTVTVRFGLNR